MTRTAALVLLLAAVLLAPLATAKDPGVYNPDASTATTLYMHLIDVQDFPVNTQEPDDKWTQDTSYGVATSTTSCLPKDTPGAAVSQQYHTFYGYSSPSYVEYLQEEGGKPRVHPERGISYDALLDTSAPFTVYWYLTVKGPVRSDGDLPSADSVPVPVPNVVVTATLRTGDSVSIDDRAYNTGIVLAQGRSTPATLVADQVMAAPGGAPPVETTALGQQPDGKWLYQVAVPMSVEQPAIPRSTGYNLRVDVAMDNPACTQGPDAALMPNTVAIHSSAGHRPRMELSITNPLRITSLHPQFVGDDLVVHAAANAAWGNYDVGEPSPYTPDVVDGLSVVIEGPSPAASLALNSLVSETNPHYAHQNDVTVVYVWPYKADRAAPGVYTVTFTAKNDRGNAEAVAVSQFEIGKRNSAMECDAEGCGPTEPVDDDGRRATPAVPAGLALAALAALASVRRRRA
jgi:MYXO-CTERM domain-containing protein